MSAIARLMRTLGLKGDPVAPHVCRFVRLRRGYPHQICKCGALKIGSNTISMSPGGVDVMKWSGSQATAALGELGMDIATGRPSAFVGGVDAALALLSEIGGALNASLFTFTHTTGAASTGALGFTPKACIMVGVVEFALGDFFFNVGIATGTGGSARSACFGAGGGSQAETHFLASDLNAIFGRDSFFGSATYDRELDVTAFGASNITLTWSNFVTSLRGSLLVLG